MPSAKASVPVDGTVPPADDVTAEAKAAAATADTLSDATETQPAFHDEQTEQGDENDVESIRVETFPELSRRAKLGLQAQTMLQAGGSISDLVIAKIIVDSVFRSAKSQGKQRGSVSLSFFEIIKFLYLCNRVIVSH